MPRVSTLKKAEYGIITVEIVEELCQQRMLYADLLARSSDPETAHAAFMVRETVTTLRLELLGLII